MRASRPHPSFHQGDKARSVSGPKAQQASTTACPRSRGAGRQAPGLEQPQGHSSRILGVATLEHHVTRTCYSTATTLMFLQQQQQLLAATIAVGQVLTTVVPCRAYCAGAHLFAGRASERAAARSDDNRAKGYQKSSPNAMPHVQLVSARGGPRTELTLDPTTTAHRDFAKILRRRDAKSLHIAFDNTLPFSIRNIFLSLCFLKLSPVVSRQLR